MEQTVFPRPEAWIIEECKDDTIVVARYRPFPTPWGLPVSKQGRWEVYIYEVKVEFLRVPHLV